jgi:hypothetical protein
MRILVLNFQRSETLQTHTPFGRGGKIRSIHTTTKFWRSDTMCAQKKRATHTRQVGFVEESAEVKSHINVVENSSSTSD